MFATTTIRQSIICQVTLDISGSPTDFKKSYLQRKGDNRRIGLQTQKAYNSRQVASSGSGESQPWKGYEYMYISPRYWDPVWERIFRNLI